MWTTFMGCTALFVLTPVPTGPPVDDRAAGYLGASIQQDDAGTGFRLTDVKPNTAASAAGLKVGDLVTKLNGKAYDDQTSFIRAIMSITPGRRFEMEIDRGGAKVRVAGRIGTRPADLPPPERETPVPLPLERE